MFGTELRFSRPQLAASPPARDLTRPWHDTQYIIKKVNIALRLSSNPNEVTLRMPPELFYASLIPVISQQFLTAGDALVSFRPTEYYPLPELAVV